VGAGRTWRLPLVTLLRLPLPAPASAGDQGAYASQASPGEALISTVLLSADSESSLCINL